MSFKQVLGLVPSSAGKIRLLHFEKLPSPSTTDVMVLMKLYRNDIILFVIVVCVERGIAMHGKHAKRKFCLLQLAMSHIAFRFFWLEILF